MAVNKFADITADELPTGFKPPLNGHGRLEKPHQNGNKAVGG